MSSPKDTAAPAPLLGVVPAAEERARLAEGIIARAQRQLECSFDIGVSVPQDGFQSVLESSIHAAWKSEAAPPSTIGGGGGPQWLKLGEYFPEFPEGKHYVECNVLLADNSVMSATYRRAAHATTERGRKPRWERNGRSWHGLQLTHFQYLPAAAAPPSTIGEPLLGVVPGILPGELIRATDALALVRDALNDSQADISGRDCDVDVAHYIDVVLTVLKAPAPALPLLQETPAADGEYAAYAKAVAQKGATRLFDLSDYGGSMEYAGYMKGFPAGWAAATAYLAATPVATVGSEPGGWGVLQPRWVPTAERKPNTAQIVEVAFTDPGEPEKMHWNRAQWNGKQWISCHQSWGQDMDYYAVHYWLEEPKVLPAPELSTLPIPPTHA